MESGSHHPGLGGLQEHTCKNSQPIILPSQGVLKSNRKRYIKYERGSLVDFRTVMQALDEVNGLHYQVFLPGYAKTGKNFSIAI